MKQFQAEENWTLQSNATSVRAIAWNIRKIKRDVKRDKQTSPCGKVCLKVLMNDVLRFGQSREVRNSIVRKPPTA